MTAVRVTLVVLVMLLAQLLLGARVEIFGVRPELLLLLAIVVGLTAPHDHSVVLAFGIGLFVDLNLSEGLLGVAALSYALVTAAISSVGGQLSRSLMWGNAVLVGGATAVGVIGQTALGRLLGVGQLGWTEALVVAVVAGILNAVLSAPAVWCLSWAWGPANQLTEVSP